MRKAAERVEQHVRFSVVIECADESLIYREWQWRVLATEDWPTGPVESVKASGRTQSRWGARRAAQVACRRLAGRVRRERWSYEAEG